MKIKIIYRNYIPLYSAYSSFWESNIKEISFYLDKPNKKLFPLFKIYRQIKKFPKVNQIIDLVQERLFENVNFDKYDYLFYTGIVPVKIPEIPYMIDFEHISALFNFIKPDKEKKAQVWKVLANKNCRAILPWSKAAAKTLSDFYGKDYEKIKNKVKILYPALPIYSKKYLADYSIVKKNKKIKILFVGKDYKRKGLPELIEAVKILNKKFENKFELYIVSDYKSRERINNVFCFLPNFSQEEIIKKFFLTCDLFVMPTHQDSFGMVLLEALACGLPIISTKQFAIKEFLKNEVNGFLINSDNLVYEKELKYHWQIQNFDKPEEKMINDLVEKIGEIIENPKILDKMKKNTIKDFLDKGKFSIEERNKEMKEIFK